MLTSMIFAIALAIPTTKTPDPIPPAVPLSALLPEPTPCLGELAQELNYLALTQGFVAKEAITWIGTFKVRSIGKVFVLYNPKEHVIMMAQWGGFEPLFGLAEADENPFPNTPVKIYTTKMDGETYSVRIIPDKYGFVLAVYNSKGSIIFAMADPVKDGLFLPECPNE